MNTDTLSELYSSYTRTEEAIARTFELCAVMQTELATARSLVNHAKQLRQQRLNVSLQPLVLVVDDDEAIREFISEVLADEGYEVIAASDGFAAFSLVQQYRPQVILLDMRMPVWDGPAFLEKYSELNANLAPVIAMSANSAPSLSAALVKEFLPKPFDLTVLLDSVKRHAFGSC